MTVPPSDRRGELEALWRAGAALHPGVALTLEGFLAWADTHLDPAVAAAGLEASEVFLAAGCVHGAAGAARAFIDGPLRKAEPSVAKILPAESDRAELMQELATHLLLPGPADGDLPRLAHFDGRAPLRAWLRMIAARKALDRVRGKTRVVSLDAMAFDAASETDPELSVLRRQHKDEIAAIFAEAIAAVAPEDRKLLRLHYVQGSTLAELAALERTSKSSLHRRFESIREQLFERLQVLMRHRMRLPDSQQGSMLRIFHSGLRDAVAQLLRHEP